MRFRTWHGFGEHKVRLILILIGIAVCVLAASTPDGMLGYMRVERNRDTARFRDRLLFTTPGAGYLPFKSVLAASTADSMLTRQDMQAVASTPLLFVVMAPPDNPMDEAGVIGLGLQPGREEIWLGKVKPKKGTASLLNQGDDAVILGSLAAAYYRTTVGRRIFAGGKSWRVVGVLAEAGVARLDTLAIIPLQSLQRAYHLQGWISAVAIAPDPGTTSNFARMLRRVYPDYQIFTQQDLRRLLNQELSLPDRFLSALSWLALLIAVMILAYMMSIIVRERAQRPELLKAASNRRPLILGSTLIDTILIGLAGGGLGMAAAVPTAYALGWTWILTWSEGLRVLGLILTAGLLAGLYPAVNAMRLYPQSLRYDELRRQMETVSAEKRELNQAYQQLIQVREGERERVARELHDQVIQNLVGLKFHLAEAAAGHMAELQGEINEIIDQLRGVCADLRPPALESLGLVAALRAYIENLGQRSDMAIAFTVQGEEYRLTPEQELTLFRVGQEALANAWRHAKAASASMNLVFAQDGIRLIVSDTGVGFSKPARFGMLAEKGHFGLVNIEERLELVGGTLSVMTAPGEGTVIEAFVPKK